MAKRYKYVVKKIENLCQIQGCSKKAHITWDVYKQDSDGFELFAECHKREDAILVAKAVNLFKNRASTKCL